MLQLECVKMFNQLLPSGCSPIFHFIPPFSCTLAELQTWNKCYVYHHKKKCNFSIFFFPFLKRPFEGTGCLRWNNSGDKQQCTSASILSWIVIPAVSWLNGSTLGLLILPCAGSTLMHCLEMDFRCETSNDSWHLCSPSIPYPSPQTPPRFCSTRCSKRNPVYLTPHLLNSKSPSCQVEWW